MLNPPQLIPLSLSLLATPLVASPRQQEHPGAAAAPGGPQLPGKKGSASRSSHEGSSGSNSSAPSSKESGPRGAASDAAAHGPPASPATRGRGHSAARGVDHSSSPKKDHSSTGTSSSSCASLDALSDSSGLAAAAAGEGRGSPAARREGRHGAASGNGAAAAAAGTGAARDPHGTGPPQVVRGASGLNGPGKSNAAAAGLGGASPSRGGPGGASTSAAGVYSPRRASATGAAELVSDRGGGGPGPTVATTRGEAGTAGVDGAAASGASPTRSSAHRGEKEPASWHIFWADKDWIHMELDRLHLEPHQRVNHFRNHYELTRKDLLAKNIKRARRQLEKEGNWQEARKYAIIPTTFVLPQEYSMFAEEFRKCATSTSSAGGHHHGGDGGGSSSSSKKNVWIMKPVGLSQGKGIFMVTKLSQLQHWRPPERTFEASSGFGTGGFWGGGSSRSHGGAGGGHGKDASSADHKEPAEDQAAPEVHVVQRYIENPLVIGGKKFDLRLYVLVTSYQPLTVWLYREGFSRFSMSRFTLDSVRDPTKLSSHLTNIAVQKNLKDATYQRTGAKWDLKRMKQYFLARIGARRVDEMFRDMESIIIYSLLAVQKVMIANKHCFELYGYDILIDADYRCILIEVNASPSLTANTKQDYQMKFAMLDDVLTVIDIEKYLTGNETQVGGFDLLWKGGPVAGSSATSSAAAPTAAASQASAPSHLGNSTLAAPTSTTGAGAAGSGGGGAVVGGPSGGPTALGGPTGGAGDSVVDHHQAFGADSLAEGGHTSAAGGAELPTGSSSSIMGGGAGGPGLPMSVDDVDRQTHLHPSAAGAPAATPAPSAYYSTASGNVGKQSAGSHVFTSKLGSYNDREEQLARLAKEIHLRDRGFSVSNSGSAAGGSAAVVQGPGL